MKLERFRGEAVVRWAGLGLTQKQIRRHLQALLGGKKVHDGDYCVHTRLGVKVVFTKPKAEK